MQSHHISLSVPYNHLAVSSAATMLTKLAEDLKVLEGAPIDSVIPTPIIEPEAKAVFQTPVSEEVEPDYIPAAPTPTPPVATVITATGVELDAAGLPWHARIHSAAKTKDAKGYWKYLRGVDREEFVPMIEAELRAMMGEPVADVPTPPAPPVPAAPVADVPTPPAPPATASTAVTTFAQLVVGITANGIDEAKVNEALAAVGLTNLALLGARADLIPTVAGHLGL